MKDAKKKVLKIMLLSSVLLSLMLGVAGCVRDKDISAEKNKGVKAINIGGITYSVNEDRNSCKVLAGREFQEKHLEILNQVNGISVTEICGNAFCNNDNLISITLPESITYIGESSFRECDNLAEIIILGKDNVTIGQEAFEKCISLKNVVLPEGVVSIESNAFLDCENLTSISLPASLTSIIDNFLYGCSNLEKIIIAKDNPIYHSVNNCIVETKSNTLISGCKDSVIPSDGTVTTIGYLAFGGQVNIGNIVIPEGIIRIEENAFHNCKKLQEITIPSSVTYVDEKAFEASNIGKVYYAGTMEELKGIEGTSWIAHTTDVYATFYCKDGEFANFSTE